MDRHFCVFPTVHLAACVCIPLEVSCVAGGRALCTCPNVAEQTYTFEVMALYISSGVSAYVEATLEDMT